MQTTRKYEKCYILWARVPWRLFFGVPMVLIARIYYKWHSIFNAFLLVSGHCNFSSFFILFIVQRLFYNSLEDLIKLQVSVYNRLRRKMSLIIGLTSLVVIYNIIKNLMHVDYSISKLMKHD